MGCPGTTAQPAAWCRGVASFGAAGAVRARVPAIRRAASGLSIRRRSRRRLRRLERVADQPRPTAVHVERGLPLLLVELSAAVELSRVDPDGLARPRPGVGAIGFDDLGGAGGRGTGYRRPAPGRATVGGCARRRLLSGFAVCVPHHAAGARQQAGVVMGGLGIIGLGALMALTHGAFWLNVVAGNANPFDFEQLWAYVANFSVVHCVVLAMAAAECVWMLRRRAWSPWALFG